MEVFAMAREWPISWKFAASRLVKLALKTEKTGWFGSGTLRLVLVIAMSMVPEVKLELATRMFEVEAPRGYRK